MDQCGVVEKLGQLREAHDRGPHRPPNRGAGFGLDAKLAPKISRCRDRYRPACRDLALMVDRAAGELRNTLLRPAGIHGTPFIPRRARGPRLGVIEKGIAPHQLFGAVGQELHASLRHDGDPAVGGFARDDPSQGELLGPDGASSRSRSPQRRNVRDLRHLRRFLLVRLTGGTGSTRRWSRRS
jgi:hypothetical protein